jgi:hypothetical protein
LAQQTRSRVVFSLRHIGVTLHPVTATDSELVPQLQFNGKNKLELKSGILFIGRSSTMSLKSNGTRNSTLQSSLVKWNSTNKGFVVAE